jgi:predicted Zn-dependent protease
VQRFRTLDPAEVARLKPLRVHIVTAAAGDTAETFVRRMRGVSRPRDLFLALNDLDADAHIAPGTKLKIVSD